MNTKKCMKKGMNKMRKINLILMIVVIIAAMFTAAAEVKQYEEKINWEPTEIYDFTNKNISWD